MHLETLEKRIARMAVMLSGFELRALWMQLYVPALCGSGSSSKEKEDR